MQLLETEFRSKKVENENASIVLSVESMVLCGSYMRSARAPLMFVYRSVFH